MLKRRIEEGDEKARMEEEWIVVTESGNKGVKKDDDQRKLMLPRPWNYFLLQQSADISAGGGAGEIEAHGDVASY